ncbi:uncharacterized protein LOC116194303 [Punica granatum]|uniref:DUF4408 domain-containing protein n=2 Tax=Punica granatum TaxID=22663 RepID=A0A218X4T4_PUNGR|nr:uncharacterized protein LOC116194303 [Punica granatum]OWM80245.1 hypothetical protein CDL15_Pgr019525 [Punica granatum]PKI36594.1 hypothetical protein CRG98_043014 [Punica granatum]
MESFRYGAALKVARAKKSDKNFLFHLKKIANLFRVMELFVVLVLLSRFSTQLPEAVKSSGKYFTDLKLAVLSPCFIFVLGNVIVITLLAKSGRFSGKDTGSKNDFYDEFIGKSERLNHGTILKLRDSDYQDKQVIFEKVVPSKDVNGSSYSEATKTAAYRRSQSDKILHRQNEKPKRELKRSVTEKCVKRFQFSEKLSIEGPFPEDSMSNDEFRQTIEAFIARQQRFLRGEE